jgi:hypothetical protein
MIKQLDLFAFQPRTRIATLLRVRQQGDWIMKSEGKILLDRRVRKYLTDQIRNEFGEDFKLIEQDLDKLVERYSLKELLIIVRLEIDRIKNPRKAE